MKSENAIINNIEKINEILSKNSYRSKRYEDDIKWLALRKKQILSNIIRVAVMGITSSGKSTLVNSILGEKLLPVAIKPSSSIIITCFKDENRQAVVYFRDKEPIILEGDDLNDSVIKKYADEAENPKNVLNVTQIDICTPHFLLGDKIHIIDSPGLDACDLEIHEKITMEVLLPTIDICIFLTTVKANSDEINVEKMRIVKEKGKEIILLQNMIDSVECKIGKDGIVEENTDVILEKHKRRAQKLLKTVFSMGRKIDSNAEESVNDRVIQISALNALKGITEKDDQLLKQSNLNEFIRKIDSSLDNLMPKINEDRMNSLRLKINSIISTDEKLIQESLGNYKDACNSVTKQDVDDIFQKFKLLKGDILSHIGNMDEMIEDVIRNIKTIPEDEINQCSNVLDKVNGESRTIERDIYSTVKECEANKILLYKKLNLDIRYEYSFPKMEYESVNMIHKLEGKTTRLKKNGVFNKGKRLFSNMFDASWGYEEKVSDEKVIDKKSTIIELQNVCNINRVKYVSIMNEWSKQYVRSINLFYNEVSKNTKQVMAKRNFDMDIEDIKEIKDELIELDKVMDGFTGQKSSDYSIKKEEIIAEKKRYQEAVINKTSYNLYITANRIIEKNYEIIETYVRNAAESRYKSSAKNIFWIWDIDKGISFIQKLYALHKFSEADITNLKKNGIDDFGDFLVVYEDGINKIKLYENLKRYYNSVYSIYVVFNGIQYGNAKKQIIKNLALKEFIQYNPVNVNLVVDSYVEFIHGNNMKEMLTDIHRLKMVLKSEHAEDKMKYILINSRNPIYNIALIECQEKEDFILSDYKDIKYTIFSNPLCKGEEEKETIEDILGYYLDYKL